MNTTTILNHNQFNLIIQRLCRQLIENHGDFSDTVIIGLQPRGVYLSSRITKVLKEILIIKNLLLQINSRVLLDLETVRILDLIIKFIQINYK